MMRLCVICEGHTEAEFVKACLEPHLRTNGIYTFPSLLKSRPGRKGGGSVTVDRLAQHIKHEYHNSDRITTLVDYYGFHDQNGRNKLQLENAILVTASNQVNGFSPHCVIPYVQMHEFEGLLFSDIEKFKVIIDGWSPDVRKKLQSIRDEFNTPEDINNSRETAPSKRILNIFPNGDYGKREHGPLIAQDIGLQKIREECPLFNDWLTRLENLS
jgi:hypothetical protein